jgi:hypothetical protein
MRDAFDEAMSKIPADQVTPALKAQLAMKAAAEGQITYGGSLAAASDQIQTTFSMLT